MNKVDGVQAGGAERQARITASGKKLFLRSGFRGVTMEAIAKEAGLAKPTLYKYFPDKESVFRAVVVHYFADLRRVAEEEFASEGRAVERISGALVAKFKLVHRILDGSPHAEELYNAQSRHAAEDFEKLERWLENEVAQILIADGHEEPHKFAQLVIACVDGISHKAKHAEQIGPAVRLVTEKILT